jgi:hypothetical protein
MSESLVINSRKAATAGPPALKTEHTRIQQQWAVANLLKVVFTGISHLVPMQLVSV